MKASRIVTAVVSCSAALALTIGGLAYANPIDPTTEPMPEKAQSTSIAKQVTAIIVYQDQEDAEAMATELQEIHDELALDAVANRANRQRGGRRHRCRRHRGTRPSERRRSFPWKSTSSSSGRAFRARLVVSARECGIPKARLHPLKDRAPPL